MNNRHDIKLIGAAAIAVTLFGAATPIARETAQTPPRTRSIVLSFDGVPTLGRTGAPLVLVEFADFDCPTSVRYSREVFERVRRDFVESGKARYVFRNFPLPKHPHAFQAAEAAQCAMDQGRFWELRSSLFANQRALELPDLLAHAKAAGAEPGAFAGCLGGSSAESKVRRDIIEGTRAGVTQTPTLLAGVLNRDGTFLVLRELSGTDSYDSIKDALDGLLASASSTAN